MNALYYIVDTLTSLYLGVLILRLIMQVVRANFRNPFAEAILKLTNPLVMPLRRVVPPVGKIEELRHLTNNGGLNIVEGTTRPWSRSDANH